VNEMMGYELWFSVCFPSLCFAFPELVRPYVYLWRPHMRMEIKFISYSFTG
jgi:hypothetical protein